MIELRNLSKTFNQGTENEVVALKNINITINDGDIFGIIGLPDLKFREALAPVNVTTLIDYHGA